MTEGFSGLGLHLGNLSRLSSAKSRSISPENPTGEKGKGGMAEEGTGAIHARGLGRGWKISPSMRVAPGETLLLGDIEGQGAIQQIWITPRPCELARSHPAHLLGRSGATRRSRRRSAISSPAAGAATRR